MAKGSTIARVVFGSFFALVALAGLVTMVYANAWFIDQAAAGKANGDDPAGAIVGALLFAVGALVAGPIAFRAPGVLFGLGITLVVLGSMCIIDAQAFRDMATDMARLGQSNDAEDARMAAGVFTGVGVVAAILGIAASVGFFVWVDRRQARARVPAGAIVAQVTEPPR